MVIKKEKYYIIYLFEINRNKTFDAVECLGMSTKLITCRLEKGFII